MCFFPLRRCQIGPQSAKHGSEKGLIRENFGENIFSHISGSFLRVILRFRFLAPGSSPNLARLQPNNTHGAQPFPASPHFRAEPLPPTSGCPPAVHGCFADPAHASPACSFSYCSLAPCLQCPEPSPPCCGWRSAPRSGNAPARFDVRRVYPRGGGVLTCQPTDRPVLTYQTDPGGDPGPPERSIFFLALCTIFFRERVKDFLAFLTIFFCPKSTQNGTSV